MDCSVIHKTISEQKSEFRIQMKQLIAKIPATILQNAGKAASKILSSEQLIQHTGSVCLFCSSLREIATESFFTLCSQFDLPVYVPRVIAAKKMEFVPVPSSNTDWKIGSFGIREPINSIAAVSPVAMKQPILFIIPGIAFSREGKRLGQGGGYYDRYFSQLQSVQKTTMQLITIGLCMTAQLVAYVPSEPHDVCVDYVLTDSEIIDTSKPL